MALMALFASPYTVGLAAFAVVNKAATTKGNRVGGEDWVERTIAPHTSQSADARARVSLDPTRCVSRTHAVLDLVGGVNHRWLSSKGDRALKR